jgi:D-amino-acid dehydrogenase
VVIGATRETGSGFDARTTAGGVKAVLDHALRIAPGLASGTVHEIRVGLRPLSADGLPFLGTLHGCDNVVVATGNGPTGLQLGPYSGLLAARLATGRPAGTDIAPFALDRVVG